MAEYPNWFVEGGGEWYFKKHLLPWLKELNEQPIAVLQIGAYTGDASVWLLDNLLGGHPDSFLTDVDTWKGSDEEIHHSLDWADIETTYDSKIKKYGYKVKKFKLFSDDFFRLVGMLDFKYDFIYVDGDHTAKSVLKDGINALEMCAPGGIVAFDDYLWRSGKEATYDPYPAIDALLVAYADKFEVIEKDVQVWVKHKG